MMKRSFFMLAIIILSSCKPIQYITLHEIEYRDKKTHDTITTVQHDSIRITQRKDTVFFQSFKTLYQDRIVIKNDSIYTTKEKPVYITKSITKKFEPNFFQKILLKLGTLFLIVLGIGIIYFVFKNLKKISPLFSFLKL